MLFNVKVRLVVAGVVCCSSVGYAVYAIMFSFMLCLLMQYGNEYQSYQAIRLVFCSCMYALD